MTEIITKRIIPDDGSVYELPTEIHRKAVERVGSNNGNLKATVVGTGELTEYVTLSVDGGRQEVPEGAEILGVDALTVDTYYLLPTDAYGGDDG